MIKAECKPPDAPDTDAKVFGAAEDDAGEFWLAIPPGHGPLLVRLAREGGNWDGSWTGPYPPGSRVDCDAETLMPALVPGRRYRFRWQDCCTEGEMEGTFVERADDGRLILREGWVQEVGVVWSPVQ